jgi:hypothetical protein
MIFYFYTLFAAEMLNQAREHFVVMDGGIISPQVH